MSRSVDLAPVPSSVRQAREWIRSYAVEHGRAADVDTLVLLVSELVSNVVLHARTPCVLEASSSDDGTVRIEVRDGVAALPRVGRPRADDAVSGRGLLLVESMASAHGADLLADGGKRVWFELAAGTRPEPPTVGPGR